MERRYQAPDECASLEATRTPPQRVLLGAAPDLVCHVEPTPKRARAECDGSFEPIRAATGAIDSAPEIESQRSGHTREALLRDDGRDG